MKVCHALDEMGQEYVSSVIALGMFDGVHLGHQSVICRAVEIARERNVKSVVFTFENHPISVLKPNDMPLQIMNIALRNAEIENLGADAICSIPFTQEFSRKSPKEFLDMLSSVFSPAVLVMGENFSFGEKGEGNALYLRANRENFDFEVNICPKVEYGGRAVSSTRIRALIADGDLDEVSELLGRRYAVSEEVVHGDKRGRLLGFPTANLAIPKDRATLPNGVYATRVNAQGKIFDGIANIGTNPTFEGCNRRIEVHINDFAEDIYGKVIKVEFLKKIRSEIKFSSVDDLVAQMRLDMEKAREIWNEC